MGSAFDLFFTRERVCLEPWLPHMIHSDTDLCFLICISAVAFRVQKLVFRVNTFLLDKEISPSLLLSPYLRVRLTADPKNHK